VTATVTIPSNPDELANFLTDDLRAEMAANPAKMAEILNGYADNFAKRHADKEQEYFAKLEMGLVDLLEKNGAELTAKFKPGQAVRDIRAGRAGGLRGKANKGQLRNAASPAAALDKEFDSAVEFFQAMWHRSETLKNHKELAAKRERHAEIINAYGSNVPSDGGFLIPEILREEIMALMLEEAIVRPLATVIPMDSLKVPIPAVDETSRVNNIYGGMQFYWSAEGAAGTDSSAKFSQITLDAKKLFGYAGIPNELMRDAPAFLGWFGAKFPSAIAWFEDVAFLNGDGTDKPLGVFNGAGTVKVTRNTGSQILYVDIVSMYSRMYPSSVKNACWLAAPDTFPQLAELSFTPSGGTTPVPVMLWQANAVGSPVATLLGRPIIFTEKVPALGTLGDLSFVDFTEYLVGDRQMMQLESSADYLFGTDKTAFRVLQRVDGRPWVQSAITPHNGSTNTLSPYVVLN
jgi:HK97 family phage major capsid protein